MCDAVRTLFLDYGASEIIRHRDPQKKPTSV